MTTITRWALVALCVGTSSPIAAQIVERPPRRVAPGDVVSGDATVRPSKELLQQLVFDYSSEGSKFRLKLAKLWVEPLEKKYFPIYFFTNPSLLIPSNADSVKVTAKELLSQFGGLLNIAFAKNYYLPGSIHDLVGPQGDFRVGAKYVEFPGSEGQEKLHGSFVGQVAGSFSWLFRLWGDDARQPNSRPDTLSQAGTFTINLRGAGNFLGGDKYRALFSDGGDTPPKFLASWQADVSLHLFNEMFLTAGYSGSSSPLVKGVGFGGISLSRPQSR